MDGTEEVNMRLGWTPACLVMAPNQEFIFSSSIIWCKKDLWDMHLHFLMLCSRIFPRARLIDFFHVYFFMVIFYIVDEKSTIFFHACPIFNPTMFSQRQLPYVFYNM